ncbi:hypothetical protein [Protaetiibacter mangrovi]|uniref:Uncharacterized protein n=1 Tax=Protaetiibacter mangrovi TaxID=2970926 RepID=A0ABT1ZI05_9MICO|nr:hypothetical protein [Protaetiibacter mangrovi]MCS0500353.1 hypothetical protein [Protaetiibacter mangrovi]TPX02658.1 hypothetical protein FJ656_21220 [Schumannella luteola]
MSRIRFALPGSWARIPLASEAEALRAVRKLTEQVTGRKEELATLRAELRGRFTRVVEAAREGGADELYIGLELVPGIPLPAWAAVFPADPGQVDLSAVGFPELARGLDFVVGAPPEGGTSETSDDPRARVHAVRHAWRRTTEVAADDVERTFELVEADYWVAAAEPNRLALITFSTALAEYEEEMLELFDAVIGTLRWPVPDEALTAG